VTTEQIVAAAIALLTLIVGGLINLLKPSKQLRTGTIVVMIAVLAASLLVLTVWKTIFIAFAKEDEGSRNLFTGQRVSARTPFEFIDMSVKEPYETQWKERVRARIRRSDGVIALISSSTPKATGELWEIQCAVEEKKSVLGIWIETGYRIKPSVMGSAPCKEWTWTAVADFINGV
jgi:hypothetical protein